jgi:3-oxoacyl-[acyl-carrier-protein] synthase II
MVFGKHMGMRRVVITGVGMVTSMGLDVPTVWSRLLAGQSGVIKLSRFDPALMERYRVPEDFPVIGGVIEDFDLKQILQARKDVVTKEDLKQIKYTDRFTQFALAASMEAVQDSGLNLEAEDPERAGVIIASGMGGVSSWEDGVQKLLDEGVRRVPPSWCPR